MAATNLTGLLANGALQTREHIELNTSLTSKNILEDDIAQTKLLASLILFAITLLCGYLPVRCLLNQNCIQFAMFAGGGVLMATAFCHLIPEAHDNYKIAKSAKQQVPSGNSSSPDQQPDEGMDVPYLEITLCCGFFFMYLVEQLMVRFINNHTHEHPCDTSTGQLVVGAGDIPDYASAGANSNVVLSSGSAYISSAGLASSSAGSELYKFIRGLLIVSAFGAHSIFDGVAIGSQETIEKVWTIFLAISCHKLIIAAVVGLELYAATLESHLWTLVHLAVFSIMSPIGIVLVVVAQETLHIDSSHPAMILLQSFATGTLLYIVFIEILQPKEDRNFEKNKLGKSFSLIGGFVVMLLVLTLIGE